MNKAWLGLAIAGGVICLSSIIVPTILSTTILNNNHDYNRGVNLLNIHEGDDLSNKVLHFDKNYTLPYIANVNKNVWVRCVIYFYERPSLQFYAGTANNKGVFGQDVWERVFGDVGINKDVFNTYQFAAFVAVIENQVDPNKCWCFYTKDKTNPNADPK
jgi:fructosamine-3-kinase